MGFSISARFRFGWYQGRDDGGQVEAHPGPSRLFSALTAAAAARGAAGIDVHDREALEWLETHPVDRITLPPHRLNRGDARVYRTTGVVSGAGKGLDVARKSSRPASGLSAMSGPVVWWWADSPETSVLDVLEALCDDVPYLGEAVSSARLTLHRAAEPDAGALRRQAGLPIAAGSAPTLSLPAPGRLAALEAQFATTRTAPSRGADRFSTSEIERVDTPTTLGLRRTLFMPEAPVDHAAPWTTGLAMAVQDTAGEPVSLTQRESVAWAVTMHRALIRMMGGAAVPPLVTGKYVDGGEPQPANRLAIQVLHAGSPASRLGTAAQAGSHILVLFPADADAEQVDAAQNAATHITRLYRHRDAEVRLGEATRLDATAFWHPPVAGTTRWWTPSPLAIAESRGRRGPNGPRWTPADSLLLAIGFVWRSRFAADQTGRKPDEWYGKVVDAVRSAGIRVAGARTISQTDMRDFAHRVSERLVLTGLTGLLDLGRLHTDESLAAIGQSRHLGGGLLLPVDLPAGLVDDDGMPLWSRS